MAVVNLISLDFSYCRVNAIHEAKVTERQAAGADKEDGIWQYHCISVWLCHGVVVLDGAQEDQDDELSDADLGDDADATETKSRRKKQQVENMPC